MATLSINVTLSDDEAADIMTTALEGGIGYWCMSGEIVRRPTDAEKDYVGWAYHSFNAYENDDENDFIGNVDYDTIRRGVNLVLNGEMVNDYYRDMITRHFTEDEAMDASGADIVVQAGLFEEIVYG